MKRIISLFILLTLLTSLALGAPVVALEEMPEDGLYSIGVQSSSKMFRIIDCLLDVQQGQMTAILTLSSSSYGFLYPGTVEEADAALRSSWIPPEDDSARIHFSRISYWMNRLM